MGFPAIDAEGVGATGLAWLLISYGYVLYYASNLISEGSDLLLLIPSMAGLVGGVVLPLLGAVPDGAIMLFSGLGDVDKAQETLSIGVGALAGSTIMLLTVPWALSVYRGRVDFSGPDEMPNYKGVPKLKDDQSLGTTGVALTPEINHGAKMMMLTTLPYLLIQVPAIFLEGGREEVSLGEHWWAGAGFVLCMVLYVFYLYTQVKLSNDTMHKLKRMAMIKESLKKGAVSLTGALTSQVQFMEQESLRRSGSVVNEATQLSNSLHTDLNPSDEVASMLKGILGDAFRGYDQDGSGSLSKKEFSCFLTDFHEDIPKEQVDSIFSQCDSDGDKTISWDEFISACYIIIMNAKDKKRVDTHPRVSSGLEANIFKADGGTEDEEEEEVPDDLAALSPEEQQSAIKRRAFLLLFAGTALVLLFADPMVDVLSELANRNGIPPFYVSFILAPLASNASEVIASQYYAAKKTRKTITVALTALEGAAAMNNTFCLSIFMALIFFRGLAWQYSAETIAIILVQLVMGTCALRDKMSSMTALFVMLLFPLSVLFVATLEYFGLD